MTAAPVTHANGAAHPHPPGVPLAPQFGVRQWPRAAVFPVPPPGARMLPLTPARQEAPSAASIRPRRTSWRPRWRLRAVNGDAVIAWAMAATVAVVAVDAAIISYSHIYDLATGQQGTGEETGIQPVLLPLSIDGVIAEASLVMLYAARHKIPASGLARFMLWLGITATVAANVAHGLPASVLSPLVHDVTGALLSAWPAGAFIGSMEMAMRLVRDVRAVADGDTPGRRQRAGWRERRRQRKAIRTAAAAAATPAAKPSPAAAPAPPAAASTNRPPARRDTAAAAEPLPSGGRRQNAKRARAPRRQPATDGSRLAAARALLDASPAMTVAELMAAGVSEGTARRAKKEQAAR